MHNDEVLFYYTTISGRSNIGFNIGELKTFVDKCLFKHEDIEAFEIGHPEFLKQKDIAIKYNNGPNSGRAKIKTMKIC